MKAIAVDEGSEEAIGASETAQAQPLPELATGGADPLRTKVPATARRLELSCKATTSGSPDDVGRRTHAVAPREGSKLALVINLLRRADGAGIVDLTEATGWLPHTTRAALTGLRKRGYAVVRERVGAGDLVYRISHAAADGGDHTAAQTDAAGGRDGEPKPKANPAA